MDNERTADVLQVALASYDRKELRVQKNYLEEQNPVLACTCFLNGHKLLQELQQGHNFDIVVLCSQMEDMSSIEFMMELRKLEHKPLLMLFDEGRRKNSSALRMEDSGSCCCVERMELKNLLRELYHEETCGGAAYAQAAEDTEDVCLRELFQRLSRAEYGHAAMLLHLLENCLTSGNNLLK